MPDISGLEIIRALKSDDRTRDIPIVAITAAIPEEETNIRAADADASAPCCKRTTPAVDPPAVDPRLLIPRLLIDSAPQTAMMR